MIGPDISGLVGAGAGFDLLRGVFGGGEVVEAAQVHVAVHGGGVLGLDDVGRRPIRHGAAELREHHAVQGIRVPGAPEVLHRRARLLHRPADLPHEGVLPYPGAAL